MSCECRIRDFLLDLDDPRKLVKSRWKGFGPRYYVTYRILLAIYTLIMLGYFISKSPKYTFIFFTNWGYAVTTLNFFVKAVVVLKYFYWLSTDTTDDHVPLISRVNVRDTPNLLQFSWLLSNIATTVGISISIIFWSILFPSKVLNANFETIQAHGINSFLLIIDLIVNAKPYRLAHFYQPITYALAYLSFSSFYWAGGGVSPFGTRWIYPFIKWNDGVVTSVGIFGCLLIAVVVHAIVVGMAKLRDCGLENELYVDRHIYRYKSELFQTEL